MFFFDRGPGGETNVLTPFEPLPRSPEPVGADDSALPGPTVPEGLLEQLGFGDGGSRVKLRDEVYQEFVRMAGGPDKEMTEERFIAIAAQIFAFDRWAARACFHACDINYSARLDRDQYLLFREAFIHEESPFAEHEAVMALRLRAVFHKYVVTRPAQRHVRGTALTRGEALKWIRDLCAGETHVRQVAEDLLPALSGCSSSLPPKSRSRITVEGTCPDMAEPQRCTSEDSDMIAKCALDANVITLEDFVNLLKQGQFQQTLRKQALSWHDVLASIKSAAACPGQPVHAFSRAVLDGRAETAILQWSGAELAQIEAGIPSRQREVISSYVPGDAINEAMKLDPHVRAVGGWRGPLAANRESEEYEIATRVLEAAQRMARDEVRAEDKLDKNWSTEGEALAELLGSGEAAQAHSLRVLAAGCRRQLQSEPPLVRVAVPAKVFGDLHGQFRDLLMLFQQFGFPSHCGGDIQTTSYVFNGDFVDRGEHQLEVLCLLFALKSIYPAHVFLLRGNHEFRDMSEMPSGNAFKRHMKWRMPSQWLSVYEAVHETFDWLPFAARVGGRVLVLHGGLGDGTWGLSDLETIQRPLRELPSNSFVLDVVWSDPSDSDHIMYKGVHENPERGDDKVHLFGPDITEKFCRREGLNIIVRSHQYVPQGYKVMHGGHMITLFSARNYVGMDENDGALLLLAPDRNGHLRVHPKTLLALPLPLEDDEDEDSNEFAAERGEGWRNRWADTTFAHTVVGVRSKVSASCGECFHFLRTGSRAAPGGRPQKQRSVSHGFS